MGTTAIQLKKVRTGWKSTCYRTMTGCCGTISTILPQSSIFKFWNCIFSGMTHITRSLKCWPLRIVQRSCVLNFRVHVSSCKQRNSITHNKIQEGSFSDSCLFLNFWNVSHSCLQIKHRTTKSECTSAFSIILFTVFSEMEEYIMQFSKNISVNPQNRRELENKVLQRLK